MRSRKQERSAARGAQAWNFGFPSPALLAEEALFPYYWRAMIPVPTFIRRLFARHATAEVDASPQELWIADLSTEATGCFRAQDEVSHASFYENEALVLELKKKGLFAWTEAPKLLHPDFVLEGEFEFAQDAPYSSCGFLFRVANETNFYAVLVSNHGNIRMDCVFNGSPRTVFGWTELPSQRETSDAFSLRVIARGNHFILLVDDRWVAEATDESFRTGHIAFAAQNYGEGDQARFRLRECFVESRLSELETWYYRYNYYEVAPPEARFRLALTYFAMGEWLSAAVQLRKMEKRRPLTADELFLKAEASLRLELLDEADSAIEACLALAPAKSEAALEKANLLYLRGRYLELRDWTMSLIRNEPDSARLRTLAGHARFNLGDYIGAAQEYARAAAAEPGQPILRMNEARAREQAGDRPGAAAAYLAAARGFFEAEADADLVLALSRLEELDPRNPELAATRAKVLFRQGRKKEAAAAIENLLAAGSRDSALFYLSGLIARESGRRELALARFKEAFSIEPSYPLYAFRHAEALFLAGAKEADEAINTALSLAPEDGWTCNLAAQSIVAKGEVGDPARVALARRLLGIAARSLPGAVEPALNLSELESLIGDVDAGLSALAAFPEAAQARNQAGNILARAGRIEEAAKEYEKAVRENPLVPEYHTNLAAALLELERWSDAQERIRKALDLEVSPRACLLAANLAMIYGDWVRAEASCRLGLEVNPADADLLFTLGRAYLVGRKIKKAEDCVTRLGKADPGRADRLLAEILESTTEALACAACGRAWRVPRELAAQSGANIRAMPPDDSPAGACPRCGKVYCIACRKAALVQNRFTCPDCGEALKLQDSRLRYLVHEHLRREGRIARG